MTVGLTGGIKCHGEGISDSLVPHINTVTRDLLVAAVTAD